MIKEKSISVIIPAARDQISFRKCLFSLAEVCPSPDEVIIVFNGEKEVPALFLREFEVKVLTIPQAVGPARARNLGARSAKGDILFFIDSDVTVSKDAIRYVTAFFEKHPETAALFGSYDDHPAEDNFLSQFKNLSHHYVHQNARQQASTFWGACGAVRRDVFFEVGGFDESYRKPSIEDIELGYRIRQAGYDIRLCKDLQVKHLKRWGMISLLKADIFYRAVPWTRLIFRDRHLINDLNLAWNHRLSVILSFFFLSCLILAARSYLFLAAAGLCAGLLFFLHRPFYAFLKNKRGLGFTLKGILWHWFHFLYSSFGFGVGMMQFIFRQSKPLKPELFAGSEESEPILTAQKETC